MKKILFTLFLIFCLKGTFIHANENRIHILEPSETVILSDNREAMFSVVTSEQSSPDVKKIASLLSDYLSKMSGATFSTEVGNGTKGIAVGVMGDFPKVDLKPEFDLNHPGQQQGYEIKSHSKGIYIIGATPIAVEYAVFDFLSHFGYRQFFPMKKWEIIPHNEKLEFALHIKEVPDYYTRNIWITHNGGWPEYRASNAHWNSFTRNGGFDLRTTHAYGAVISTYKQEFIENPEYSSFVKGKRKTVESGDNKFCLENPELINLVTSYALKQFEKDSSLVSVSMDPSDGGGWCECEHCVGIGTPSTRALYLANEVAQSVRKQYKGKKIGMYAYNQHSAPPEIDVDKDVVVNIATKFITGGYTLDELINGWKSKGAVIGIREYYDVTGWSRTLPGRPIGSNLNYLKKSIPDFYNKGARYLSSEASDAWIASGLGYYVADKIMWNIDNAQKVEEIQNDFFNLAFGAASKSIKEFYSFLDGSEPKMLASDPIGRMYRLLDQAREQVAGDVEVMNRIDDLVLYTRYVELYNNFESASGAAKQVEFDALTKFIQGVKEYRILHTLALEKGALWKKLSPDPRKHKSFVWENIAYTPNEIDGIIKNGIENNELFDFQPVEFSSDLVPAKKFLDLDKPFGKLNPRRDVRTYYTWVDSNLLPIEIMVTGGLIAHYRNRGNVRVSLYKLGGASDDGTYETLIQTDSTTVPNGNANFVSLTPNQEGLHSVVISDGNDMTSDFWTNYDKTFICDTELNGTFYFYVPKGTKKLGMYHKLARGKLYDADDYEVFEFKNSNAFQSFPVGRGQDGKIWSFKGVRGTIKLMTVPPYFSLNPKYLLVPEEVAAADKLDKTKNKKKKKRKRIK